MKKPFFNVVSVVLIASFTIGVSGFAFAQTANPATPQRKIIVFKDGVSDAEKARVIAGARATRVKWLRNDNSLAIHADLAAEVRLASNPNVVRIDDDIIVEAFDVIETARRKSPGSTASTQVTPWGIDRVNAPGVWVLGETGDTIRIGIIDTGISATHPDLIGNIKGGVSEVNYTKSWNDDNGHGSHVAGVVAAVNNTVGVVGGVPEANIYAIKVLDRRGSGYLSDVIDGIDWAIANNLQVINLSLGASIDVQSFHDAIIRAYEAGVVVVAAAGNTGGSVSYPAAYPEAIAVAATDFSNYAPYWSSQGAEVALAAPGVSIYSTYKGTKYAYMSGTSMAAPHVAAAVALVLDRPLDDTYDANHNGAWDPQEVQSKLQDTALDLGSAGRDDIYGYGLINIFAAFTQ